MSEHKCEDHLDFYAGHEYSTSDAVTKRATGFGFEVVARCHFCDKIVARKVYDAYVSGDELVIQEDARRTPRGGRREGR